MTNVAVQKTSENYDEKLGGKWEIQTLKVYLISKYGEQKVSDCFHNIQQLIIKSLQSVQKVIINDKHCFELYGYDILLDSSLKPWLLEINASPSMTANTPHDSELKINLLDDVLTILDVEKVLTGQEEQIGGFDLIYKGVPIKLPNNSVYTTLLGAFNNRSLQLKKLSKNAATRLGQLFQETQQITPITNIINMTNNKPSINDKGSITPIINNENLTKKNKNNILTKKTTMMNKPANKILGGQNNSGKVTKTSKIPAKTPISNITQSTSSTVNTMVKTRAFQQSVINNLNNMKKMGNSSKDGKTRSDIEIKYEESKGEFRKNYKPAYPLIQKKTSAENLQINDEE